MERSFKLKKYDVLYRNLAKKKLDKINKPQQLLIKKWIQYNLVGCSNPYFSGKALKGAKKGLWRYRVGNYRIIADINDNEIIIEIIDVGHRQGIYNS